MRLRSGLQLNSNYDGAHINEPAPDSRGFIHTVDLPTFSKQQAEARGFKWKKLKKPWSVSEVNTLRVFLHRLLRGESLTEKVWSASRLYGYVSKVVMDGTRTESDCRAAIMKISKGIPANTGIA
jgi:hypothetical protein